MCTFEDKRDMAWGKARILDESNKEKVRLDPCGAVIHFDDFNDCNSDFGWMVDYIVSPAKLTQLGKMQEEIDSKVNDNCNLRAMHWRNKESKKGDYPTYRYVISSIDKQNNVSQIGDIKVGRKQRELVETFFGI